MINFLIYIYIYNREGKKENKELGFLFRLCVCVPWLFRLTAAVFFNEQLGEEKKTISIDTQDKIVMVISKKKFSASYYRSQV